MKNFLLINIPLFLAAALIYFRCRSAKIPRNAEILTDLFQMLEKKTGKEPGSADQKLPPP